MIRVFVADDHAIVRKGVAQIVAEALDMVFAGEASTGHQVLRAVHRLDFDVLLLDISMPDGGGMEVLRQVRKLKPNLRVLILSMYPEKQYAVRALRCGASGYLTKETAADELVDAIRRVAAGARYVSRTLGEQLARELDRAGTGEPHETLSEREFQVAVLLARGMTVSNIAAELSLSVKTVSTYRARILEKLQVTSTPEIVRYAFEHGLVGQDVTRQLDMDI
jgi:two-component system invasion response regulator UvrY